MTLWVAIVLRRGRHSNQSLCDAVLPIHVEAPPTNPQLAGMASLEQGD
jgi:hypothetical protein